MDQQEITFRNRDMAWDIAALMLTPDDFNPLNKYPAIVSVHPFGSCKEQTSSAIYGRALADAGYVVIAYDASFQGRSGGLPRYKEDPHQRVEDISHAIDYLVTLDFVDANRIASLGICGGGGYVFNSALTEKRIKATIGVTPVNLGRLFREDFSEFNPLETLEAISQQRTAEALGAEGLVNELLPPSLEFAKQNGLTERDVFEATEYYKTKRGQAEGGATRMLFSHANKILSWDAFAFAETLMTQPMMAIVGQKIGAFGAYRDGKAIYGKSFASADRQLVELSEWSHYDLYDHPEAVALAVGQIIPFLAKHV
ncbi:alpha/beta hydrolase [Pseudoalteromonas sp. HM-SA03]|uniref:alpha/beta hydrolase n=1 Tax=Pseudoalteromonas sp. HM-SA03 TaxID=2029678 RepID=UPI000BADFFB7|nr:alpha/beta hydrolase [Pseudoalteromonas sp. HM-SA03]PAY00224.1 alpha/beta hydrolase [Pseudoalteromonas sp. HM-SA03]